MRYYNIMEKRNHKIPAARKGGCIFSLVKLAVIVLLVAGVIGYFGISYIADYAIKTITSGTGIDAGVGSVSLGITDQKCEIRNFYMSNPPNYPKGNAIQFKDAYVDANVSLSDVLSKKLINLEEVRIEGLKIAYEMKTKNGLASLVSAPESNLNDIVKILVGKNDKQKAQTAKADSKSEPYKIILDKLIFLDGDVKVGINGKIINIKLPSFVVGNLGKNSGGLTPTELVATVLGKLTKQVTIDVAAELAKDGLQIGTEVGEKAGTATQGAAGELKKSVESALKNLFN